MFKNNISVKLLFHDGYEGIAESDSLGNGNIFGSGRWTYFYICPVFYKIWTYYLVMSSFYTKFATCSNFFKKWTYYGKIRQK